MDCPKCSGVLRVTHTFSAGEGGRTSSARCSGCKKRFTLVTFVVEAEERGRGAKGLAKALCRDEARAYLDLLPKNTICQSPVGAVSLQTPAGLSRVGKSPGYKSWQASTSGKRPASV